MKTKKARVLQYLWITIFLISVRIILRMGNPLIMLQANNISIKLLASAQSAFPTQRWALTYQHETIHQFPLTVTELLYLLMHCANGK